jgi:hypothetical protein
MVEIFDFMIQLIKGKSDEKLNKKVCENFEACVKINCLMKGGNFVEASTSTNKKMSIF